MKWHNVLTEVIRDARSGMGTLKTCPHGRIPRNV